jgi:multimeric flavodoxin WrbA
VPANRVTIGSPGRTAGVDRPKGDSVSDTARQPRVVAIVGSPRANGNTSHLVDVALSELERHGIVCEKIMLGDYRVYPCEGHDECEDLAACPLDDDAVMLLDKMYAAEGLILATPVYYEDVSGQMKVFIDRNCFNNYHEKWLTSRSVGLIAVAESTGLDETIDSLRRFISLSSNTRLKALSATGFAYRIGDAAANDQLVTSVRELAVEMARQVREAPASR